jgi:hypothetical protein
LALSATSPRCKFSFSEPLAASDCARKCGWNRKTTSSDVKSTGRTCGLLRVISGSQRVDMGKPMHLPMRSIVRRNPLRGFARTRISRAAPFMKGCPAQDVALARAAKCLEREPPSQLNLPGAGCSAGNLGLARAGAGVWLREIGVIEGVEHIGANLEPHTLDE